jgi:C4-dicarboxylate-specific signal transduction histidine kinase
MIDFFSKLLASDFMPHATCFLWNPEIIWLHAVSDIVITVSYYVIPLVLVYFVRQRADLPFHWMFLMFGLFIFGCGTTHLMDVWTLWHGTYRLAGLIKAITAAASVVTAALLVQLLPQAIALPSPAQLRKVNEELEHEIGYRRRAERALLDAHDDLELRVKQRTEELALANDELKAEMARRQHADEERRKAEQSLLTLQGEMAHVSRVTTMGELTASIGHEVNQPLTAMMTNANACVRWLAAEPSNMGEARQSLQRIQRDGQRAADILRGIRELMKKRPPLPAPQNVNELIKDALLLVHDSVVRNSIDTHLELSNDVPVVLGDRAQLQQVLLNLVMNSVDALHGVSGRSRSLVITSGRDRGTGQATMKVTDSGIGVDPKLFEKLFEPFFTTKVEGMGMGLSVSRSIIERHGGQLWASPNQGPGATFHVLLPGIA